jgi:stage V sporulation protein G
MDTVSITVSVTNLTKLTNAGKLLGLADVAILLDGIEILLHGVQLWADAGKTEVRLPKYRAPDGTWQSAVSLPEELKGPMGDTVIAAGLEAGMLRSKH